MLQTGRRYTVADWHERVPPRSHAEISDVAIDRNDRIHLFVRGKDHYESEVLIYERDGAFVRAFGYGMFKNAHGLTLGPDGTVYGVDNYDHTVRKLAPDGELLMLLGTPNVPSNTGHDVKNFHHVPRSAGPFNSPTKVALAPDGEMYVTDGYGNARVHRFTADGTLRHSWGEPGSGPGEFRLPHGVLVHEDRVIVCDRENHRLQFFDRDGAYLDEWTGLQSPTNVVVDDEGVLYVVELRPVRVSVFSPSGEVLARWGERGAAPGQFIAPHGIAVDSHGDVYITETTWTLFGRHGNAPDVYPQIQRFVRS